MPPSSIDVFLIVGAHCASSVAPTAVDPVKDSLRITGLSQIALLIGPADPVTMLHTPAGRPARSASTPSASAEKGVAEAGRTIPVHPAAQPGPTLRVIIAAGKFHGVIAANTPIGCLKVRIRRPGALGGITSP